MIISGLINACVETLQEQGMKSLLLDAVTDHLQRLKDLGKNILIYQLCTSYLPSKAFKHGLNIEMYGRVSE